MKAISRLLIVALACCTLSPPVFAFYTGLRDANGECPFSKEFIADYKSAQKKVSQLRSAEPLLELAKIYRKSEEQAELELSIGLVYGQRTRVVDPAQAVLHFSNALKFNLPEETRLEILMWRGDALEQLHKHDAALRDYLRGLLACSYYDLSGGWPEFKPPNVLIPRGPQNPEDVQRARDYQQYRKTIDFQRFLFTQRYFLIEAVKRVQTNAAISEAQIREILTELSPDTSRYAIVIGFIKSENKRPWP